MKKPGKGRVFRAVGGGVEPPRGSWQSTSIVWVANPNLLVVNPSRSCCSRIGVMQCLSRDPHPRDKRACLPKFHHPTKKERNTKCKSQIPKVQRTWNLRFVSCRRRSRTFTEQLAKHKVQWSTLVGSVREYRSGTALCIVYPVIPTPETRGYVCQISSSYSIAGQYFGIKIPK